MPLLVVLFLVMPVAELAVIVAVAGQVGILETIALLVLISVVGAWLVKREGISVLRRLQSQLHNGKLPHHELIDGFLVLFAGALLLTPGFLTDLLALVLLLPPTRALVRNVVGNSFRRRSAAFRVVTSFGPGSGRRSRSVFDVHDADPRSGRTGSRSSAAGRREPPELDRR